MYWIALKPSRDEDATAWGWRALQFTPRVAAVEEAILLEAGASERLFGGRRSLLRSLLKDSAGLQAQGWAAAPTARVALALLRLKLQGASKPELLPDGLPLATLSEARAHLPTLERIGCNTFGGLRDLPRAGLSRRFGAGLLQALDCAYGHSPERYPWLELPTAFDQKLELPALATCAPELLDAVQHLLRLLQLWLQARNLGALALELEWTLDLRRLDGRLLPPHEQLVLRTAQPTQDMRHLQRLAGEQLARTAISAPANHLRLRTLETVPWGGASTSLLPEDNRPGEKLHQLVERLSTRLGENNVVVPQPSEDHRPECMQQWTPADSMGDSPGDSVGVSVGWDAEGTPAMRESAGVAARAQPTKAKTQPTQPRTHAAKATQADPLLPPWLLREPLALQVRGDKPWYQGPLQLLTRARRLEAAWWDPQVQEPVLRDYFIARSETAGLLWVYRERLAADQEHPHWFLHGLYA